jgi:hypothetical protein
MRFRVLGLVCAFLAAFPACAFAAMVSPKAGEVRIGAGQGFQLIVAPTEVAAGAQVMVSPTGAASIAYSNDCVVPAPAAAITVVESRPPCKSFPKPSYFGFAQSNEEGITVDSDAFGFAPKVDAPDSPEKTDAPGPVASTHRRPRPVHESARRNDHALLIVGGVIVGAGALAAILASQGKDGPASP